MRVSVTCFEHTKEVGMLMNVCDTYLSIIKPNGYIEHISSKDVRDVWVLVVQNDPAP